MKARTLVWTAVIFLLVTYGCARKEPPVSEAEVKAVFEVTLPNSAEDSVWNTAPVHVAKLLVQDVVEPRLMELSTPYLRVQSITDGRNIAFRLQWNDQTRDDVTGSSRFGDAVAVQLPAGATRDVPAPQMGEPGKPVEIVYWSAVFQATVDGRKDQIQAIYPHATVDHYPFEATGLEAGSPAQQKIEQRYAPARALGNTMAGPRAVPVQDLLAEGPGTTRPAAKTVSQGRGEYTEHGWTVILIRPVPSGAHPGMRTQVAFAVWDGSRHEVGARKMRSPWIPLALGNDQ